VLDTVIFSHRNKSTANQAVFCRQNGSNCSAYGLFKKFLVIQYNFLSEKKSKFSKPVKQPAFFFGTILVITILCHLISVTENCSKNNKKKNNENGNT